jgi:hypothetical protein
VSLLVLASFPFNPTQSLLFLPHRPIMTKATPMPAFGICFQPASDRIPMDVAKLLHELVLAPEIEIVVALPPEWFFRRQNQLSGNSLALAI